MKEKDYKAIVKLDPETQKLRVVEFDAKELTIQEYIGITLALVGMTASNVKRQDEDAYNMFKLMFMDAVENIVFKKEESEDEEK